MKVFRKHLNSAGPKILLRNQLEILAPKSDFVGNGLAISKYRCEKNVRNTSTEETKTFRPYFSANGTVNTLLDNYLIVQ